jgi:hypothetical protein
VIVRGELDELLGIEVTYSNYHTKVRSDTSACLSGHSAMVSAAGRPLARLWLSYTISGGRATM